MVFIWQGWGWITLVVACFGGVGGALVDTASGGVFGDRGAVAFGLLLSAIVSALWAFLVVERLARRRHPEITFWQAQRMNTLFFIPMLFWAPVLLVLAVLAWLFMKS